MAEYLGKQINSSAEKADEIVLAEIVTNTDITSAIFTFCKLKNYSFNNVRFYKCDFRNVILENVKFIKRHL